MVSVYFDVSASNGKHYQKWCDVFKVNKKVFQIYSFYLPCKRRKELSTNYAKTESTVNFKPTGKQLSNACARKRGKLFNQWEGPQVSIIRVFTIFYNFSRGIPWVPETFLARFPVSVKSFLAASPLVASAYGRRCVGLRPTPQIPAAREKNLWHPGYSGD